MTCKSFCRRFANFFLLTALIAAALCGNNAKVAEASDTWVVQWYLCGSDLERRFGSATADLQELLSVNLPPNVKFVIQTGGTAEWQNDTVSNGEIERYLYDDNGFQQLESFDGDMGDVETLSDFIRYGAENFDADHRVFIFWDHGGGSVNGFCKDENTGNKLRVNNLTEAFDSVYYTSPDNPPFDIIGFDACLMATYDIVNALDGFTSYVVASQEIESGYGWDYTGWASALANNPSMDGAQLGKIICDTFMDFLSDNSSDEASQATLSVIDMSRLPELREAYENYGTEALLNAYENPRAFFSRYGRSAMNAERYGSNSDETGYTNMVDIADIARGTGDLLPNTSDALINAVDNAVAYEVRGNYRRHGSGISGFYAFSAPYVNVYLNLNSGSLPHKYLYHYLVSGRLSEEAKNFLRGQTSDNSYSSDDSDYEEDDEDEDYDEDDDSKSSIEKLKKSKADTDKLFDLESLDDTPVDVDDDGNAVIKLTQEQMDLISSVRCHLTYLDKKDNMFFMGSDSDVNVDWEKGIIKDNFRGVWPMLDGHFLYIDIVEDNEDYNVYSVPILLNGVECNLKVIYDFTEEKYKIIGAQKGLDSDGMADRELIKLKEGDKITTFLYQTKLFKDDDIQKVKFETFKIGKNPTIKDEKLKDGEYGYLFEFVSPTQDGVFAKAVSFEIKKGEIITSN